MSKPPSKAKSSEYPKGMSAVLKDAYFNWGAKERTARANLVREIENLTRVAKNANKDTLKSFERYTRVLNGVPTTTDIIFYAREGVDISGCITNVNSSFFDKIRLYFKL